MWIFFFVVALYILYRLLNKNKKTNISTETRNPKDSQARKNTNAPIPAQRKAHNRALKVTPSSNEFIPSHITSFIAGIPHRLGKNIQINSILSAGQNLQYLREPGNKHDKNAIKLMANGVHIGYIPKDDNPKIALHLDSGNAISVTVLSIDSSDLWRGVQIRVVLN